MYLKILGKTNAFQLKSMKYDFFTYHSDKIQLNCLVEFLIYYGGNCGRSDDFTYYLLNSWMVAWWADPRFMIFQLFSILFYVKWSVQTDFPLTFNSQLKQMELWQFFLKKIDIICHNLVNFVGQSKVNGKSDSSDHFTRIILHEVALKIIKKSYGGDSLTTPPFMLFSIRSTFF